MNPKLEPLSEVEEQWVREQLDQARLFSEEFAPGVDPPTSLEALDQAFASFLSSDHRDGAANAAILAVGTAFGAKLVEELGFRWMIATDDYGTEPAVLARPGRGDVTIFPNDFVAKRYGRRETGFLVEAVEQIRETLREIAEMWGDPD